MFLEGLTLVVVLFTLGQCYFNLGVAIFEIHAQWNQRVAGLANLAGELADLLAVHKQLALTPGEVVGPRSLEELWDVDILKPDLAALYRGKAID